MTVSVKYQLLFLWVYFKIAAVAVYRVLKSATETEGGGGGGRGVDGDFSPSAAGLIPGGVTA